jgi:hypothetical protein
MRSDTMSMLNEFTGEQLLWLAVRSNANMRAKVARVIESRAQRGASSGVSTTRGRLRSGERSARVRTGLPALLRSAV